VEVAETISLAVLAAEIPTPPAHRRSRARDAFCFRELVVFWVRLEILGNLPPAFPSKGCICLVQSRVTLTIPAVQGGVASLFCLCGSGPWALGHRPHTSQLNFSHIYIYLFGVRPTSRTSFSSIPTSGDLIVHPAEKKGLRFELDNSRKLQYLKNASSSTITYSTSRTIV